MVQLARVVVDWAGPQIKGTAASVLYFECPTGTPPIASIKNAFSQLSGALPVGVVTTVPGTGDLINDNDGVLTNAWTASGGGATISTGPAAAAAGVGACVSWSTGTVVAGHRVRGRTFIVPLANAQYDTDGTLAATAVSAIGSFATTLRGVAGFTIWHRNTGPGLTDGKSAPVVGHILRDKVAILTSRRD